MAAKHHADGASPAADRKFAISPGSLVLPERVRQIIAREDRAAEILVGWVQLGLGVLLGVLYVFSPIPADADRSGFMPVPLALAAFLTFSAFRLWLIIRNKVPDWFVAFSICVDIGLLIGLIWSFHIQYAQPPGFSLKAPTFAYLFVMVIVRALRFDPRYVLTAGLVAVAGWSLLTLAAVVNSAPGAITRNFTDYINSSQILIGAEFDKIFALLLATALLTFNARKAQAVLVSAVREQSAVHEIQRFLSRGVADQIARSDTLVGAGQAEERHAAILMLDIRGFTTLAMRLPPTEVVRILTSLHARIIPIVQANNGVVDKFLGDGVMITFGAVEASTTPAADGLRALESILETCREWEAVLPSGGVTQNLKVNAALTSGLIVFATLGDKDRLEYTVIGDAVNLAAKLEKHNKAARSRALVLADTLALAVQQGHTTGMTLIRIQSATVAGVSDAVNLYAVPT